MPESKNLCLQNGAGVETISQREKEGQHGLGGYTGYTSRPCNCNNFNVNGLFEGTGEMKGVLQNLDGELRKF